VISALATRKRARLLSSAGSAAMLDILGIILMIVGAGILFSYLDVIIGSSFND
jgi:hypothetical protein